MSLSDLVTSHPSITTPSPARLTSLYTFTSNQRVTNLTGYTANVKWWSTVIDIVVREGWLSPAGDRLTLTVDDGMVRRLEWPGVGKAKGLGGVLSTLTDSQPLTLLPLQPFLASPYPINAPSSLLSRLVTRPLIWSLSKLNPFSSPSTPSSSSTESESSLWRRVSTSGSGSSKGTYVHLPLLEEAAQGIIAKWEVDPPVVYSERVFDVAGFREAWSRYCFEGDADAGGEVEGKMLTLSDCKVLLRYLQRDKGVLISDPAGEVYKLVQDGIQGEREGITEADKGTVVITATIRRLEREVSSVERDIQAAKLKATSYIAQKQQPAALAYLRIKKQLEGVLEKRLGSLGTLREVLRGIDGAKGDIEIMQAYSQSTTTLQTILSHPSLQSDHIDSTMDALASALSDAKEMDDAVRIGQEIAVDAGGVGIDEDELEKELAGLVDEERAKSGQQGQSAGGGKGGDAEERAAKEEEREAQREKARKRREELERELEALKGVDGDLPETEVEAEKAKELA